MKKIFLLSFVLFPTFSFAYTPLTDIGAIDAIGKIGSPLVTEISGKNSLAILFNQAVYVMLAIAIALAIFMIIRGGYSYIMSADNGGAKTDAKGKIQAAFGGLLLALGAFVILQFINPEILKVQFDLPGLERMDGQKNYTLEDLAQAKKRAEQLKREDVEKIFSNGFQEMDADLLIKREGYSDKQVKEAIATLQDLIIMDSPEIYSALKTQLERESGGLEYADFLKTLFDTRLALEIKVSQPGYSDYADINRRILKTDKTTLANIKNVLNRFEEINSSLPNTKNEQSIFIEEKQNYSNAAFGKINQNCTDTKCY